MKPAQAPSTSLRDRIAGSDPLRRALLACTAVMLAAALGLPQVLALPPTITNYFFVTDALWLTGIAFILALGATVTIPEGLGRWVRLAQAPARSIGIVAFLVVLVTLIGTFVVFHGVPLSYDEVMADFDAKVFLGGHPIAPIAPEWRHSVPALATSFVLPVPNDAAWVSAYLPVNAVFRASFALFASPTLTGPVLLAVAVLALAGIARRLWPDRPDAALVAVLMLATSPQVLIAAMTPYAMTAHLALNFVWLQLFLRGGRHGHGGAIATGFLACGLHQVIFHPLFALPFLVGLITGRRWRLAALYLAAYAAIGAFWTLYWHGLLVATGYAGQGEAVGCGFMVERVAMLLRDFEWRGLETMAMNVVRFAAWQSPLLLPLTALAWPAIRRGEGLARPLAAGLFITVGAMFVLLPYQGHGWGYRYLHGLIGNASLLAAYGWIRITGTPAPHRRSVAAAILGLGWIAAVLILVPGRALEANRFAAPYAKAVEAIARSPADIVLVDDANLVYGMDLVRNDPYLRERPTVLLLRRLSTEKLAELCATRTIALFGQTEGARFGIALAQELTAPAVPAIPCSVAAVPVP
ncbi:hypothetical protein FV232_07185 [Methylobacterium sp. WL30]|uniref:hypothetical protein n=1 Tax=unclassified Methylobacterium TaxID=2615210 RepID=UPI0011CC5E53|nr:MULTISPECIES: hypothetical protein [unclassified Methylobacterium]TXN40981.1 hypothetical protein FV225_04280 [Methylobacterium sp. WL93]TXN51020.1 hypothetical protein FV227_09385 [Methylobacterium sp. WL119]TXN69011.1 hypothetical protein FV232_07185 [Methylobacterium sp. WL30]